jgi:hypothetical protein
MRRLQETVGPFRLSFTYAQALTVVRCSCANLSNINKNEFPFFAIASFPASWHWAEAAEAYAQFTHSHKYGSMAHETMLEIPDAIFRRAKTPFRALVSEALADKLRAQGDRDSKPWMKTFGKLRHLHKETARINRIMEEEVDQVETEDQL